MWKTFLQVTYGEAFNFNGEILLDFDLELLGFTCNLLRKSFSDHICQSLHVFVHKLFNIFFKS
jgi:hypothetical protein